MSYLPMEVVDLGKWFAIVAEFPLIYKNKNKQNPQNKTKTGIKAKEREFCVSECPLF